MIQLSPVTLLGSGWCSDWSRLQPFSRSKKSSLQGNQSQTATELGISCPTLYELIQKLGIAKA